MNSANSSVVSSPRACAASRSLRSASISLTALHRRRVLATRAPASSRRTARRAPRGAACPGSPRSRPGLVRAPLVVVELPDRAGDVVGQRVQLHLGEPGVVAVAAGQLSRSAASAWSSAARTWSRVPSRLPRRGLARSRRIRSASSSSPPRPSEPAAHQVAQRVAQVAGRQTSRADLVHRRAHVVRRGQRVGPAAPRAVAVPVGAPPPIAVRRPDPSPGITRQLP